MSSIPTLGQGAFGALRQFVRKRPPGERCELCSLGLPTEHEHLLELANRQLVCSCQACAILFSGNQSARYRRVPYLVQALPGFRLGDEQWDSLSIPIDMAFFCHASAAGRVMALYPSPGGVIESSLTLESWAVIVADNPVLAKLAPDVEALLVNRIKEAREFYLVSIDQCYKLVGLIRSHWRGLSGGTEVWQEIGRFFEQLKERSRPALEMDHA
jgi:Family of unknown function (DUF5947)